MSFCKSNIYKIENNFSIFIFPHAGGNSYFYKKFLNDEISQDVKFYIYEMPGHGLRSEEPFARDFQDLIEDAYRFITPHVNKKLIFVGHSMGALLAHRLARQLKLSNENIYLLLASASEPPGVFVHEKSHAPHWKKEDLWVEYIQKKENVLNNMDAATRDFFHISLSADFKIMKSFFLEEEEGILDCPIWVMYGQNDKAVNIKHLEDWRQYTSQSVYYHAFSGGHFYIIDHFPTIINLIKAFTRHLDIS